MHLIGQKKRSNQNLFQWILILLAEEGGIMCIRHGAGLDWPVKKISGNILLIFVAIKICSELCICCQSTLGHLPELSAKFQD